MKSKFKIGDVVRVVKLIENSGYSRLDDYWIGLIGVIVSEEHEGDVLYSKPYYVVEFSSDEDPYIFEEEIIKATEREEFLYYTHGPKALKNEEE